MSTIRVVNIQHPDSVEPNVVLKTDGTAVFASGITISGSTNLTVSGTAEFASGTAASPEITFIDDNDTGIYSPAANEVAITTNGTERLRVDNTGQVGIGTNNPGYKLDVEGGSSSAQFTSTVNWNFSNVYIKRKASNAALAKMISMELDGDSASETDFTNNLTIWGTYNSTPTTGSTSNGLNAGMNLGAPGGILFHVDGSERVRIDSSGNLFTGGTNSVSAIEAGTQSGKVFKSNHAASSGSTGTGTSFHFSFANPNGFVGSISTNGSATAFNTSSDYRLKENVVDLEGAINRVKQLAPKRFNFIADADITVDGFLAHEAQAIVPEAVTGTHNEVDDEGNPVMQGIDQAKLVPLLTAALQEAVEKIETLEQRLTDAGL